MTGIFGTAIAIGLWWKWVVCKSDSRAAWRLSRRLKPPEGAAPGVRGRTQGSQTKEG
jgi:hypothetical protein